MVFANGYQGNESHVVIYNMVVTDKPGFTNNIYRTNVAMSRARDGLVVVGKLTCTDNWKRNVGREDYQEVDWEHQALPLHRPRSSDGIHIWTPNCSYLGSVEPDGTRKGYGDSNASWKK